MTNSNTSFFVPSYIDIVHKVENRWMRLGEESVLNLSDKPYDKNQKFSEFGLTAKGVLIELFKRYKGLDGWYLIHLADKDYYFCPTAEDVQEKLYELGINNRA